jgi:Flp pilus assembly protein TadB
LTIAKESEAVFSSVYVRARAYTANMFENLDRTRDRAHGITPAYSLRTHLLISLSVTTLVLVLAVLLAHTLIVLPVGVLGGAVAYASWR